jgi:hypothetical protein
MPVVMPGVMAVEARPSLLGSTAERPSHDSFDVV